MIQVAVLWMVNEDGEMLLAQRAHHKAQDPSVWGPAVTGKLEPGETFDQALMREVKEELDLEPADYQPTFLFQRDFDHPDGEQRTFGFYYTIFSKAKTSLIHPDANEVAGVDWFTLDAILEKMKSEPNELVPSALATWPDILSALKKAEVI